jgi:hypothetical protein
LNGSRQGAKYFTAHKETALPPQIRSISVDNYAGTITVDSDRVNKIQWITGNKILKTKYNVGGLFTTKFSVEGLEEPEIHFVLFGQGGATGSQSFGLREA